MNKIIKILPLISLGILSILLTTGKVHFGYGLGDILYYALVYIGLVVYGIYYFRKKETAQISLIFPISSTLFCIYLILIMTIWRGPEYPWNGKVLALKQGQNAYINNTPRDFKCPFV